MPEPFMLISHPEWSVRSMTVDQIPLVVSWIVSIDSRSNADGNALIAQMRRELRHARKRTPSEYYVGYHDQLPTFFMVGFPISDKKNEHSLPGTKWRDDYEITSLVVNTVLPKELYLPLYHQAVKFLLTRENTGRILLQIEKKDEYLQSVLSRLGFKPHEYRVRGSLSHCWYACRRSDFI